MSQLHSAADSSCFHLQEATVIQQGHIRLAVTHGVSLHANRQGLNEDLLNRQPMQDEYDTVACSKANAA